jgi:hypothetical protein
MDMESQAEVPKITKGRIHRAGKRFIAMLSPLSIQEEHAVVPQFQTKRHTKETS